MPIMAAPALEAKASALTSSRANTAVRSNLTTRSLNTAQRESCGPDAHERRISSQAKYHWSRERAPTPRARPSLGDEHLSRALRRQALQRALPRQPGQGPDRPLDRLRPADPDRL